ncbi:MAG TPA: hypothetical protein VLQ80_25830, partial [Candidatus Saccharimonadia bacterium]|nr:hypothetical protein [Candidatus Saccharimonadia bacterium]
MPSDRITIRLSPTLAARLAATVGPHETLAAIVRHAIEAYLDTDPASRQPPAATLADVADMADDLADLTARVAAVQVWIETVEQRLTALEAVAAASRQRQSPRQPVAARAADTPSPQMLGTYDPQAAVARIQALRRQGYSLARIADQLTAEGIPTRYGLPWQHSS